MTDDAKPMNRHKRWRLENPDKAREQQRRKRLRAKGLLPPYERPPTLDRTEERKAYMRDWHKKRLAKYADNPDLAERAKEQARNRARTYWQRIKADPEKHAAYLEKKKLEAQGRVRVKTTQPTDAPPSSNAMSIEERKRRNTESKRRAYRLKHGIPLDTPVGFRVGRKPTEPKKPKQPKKLDQERARRAAEIEAAKAAKVAAAPVKPPPCPDPPALQELFRKASKGEPPRPFPASGRRRSVFHLRGVY